MSTDKVDHAALREAAGAAQILGLTTSSNVSWKKCTSLGRLKQQSGWPSKMCASVVVPDLAAPMMRKVGFLGVMSKDLDVYGRCVASISLPPFSCSRAERQSHIPLSIP